MATAILQLNDLELRSSDPFLVRSLWRLMATAVDEKDVEQLNAPQPVPEADRL